MNIVFFNNPVGTEKLNFIVTDKSPSQLKKEKIIPKDSATLIKPYKEDMNEKEKSFLVHIDKAVFDNYKTPTNVEFDMDLIRMFFIDLYRNARTDLLSVLDALQLRAFMSGKSDIANQIEEDKQKLRDLPETVYHKIETLDCFFKINKVIPKELLVDYKEKYGYLLK